MSVDNNLREIGAAAIKGAAERGISEAKVTVSRSRSVEVTFRGARPDKVKESARRSLTVHLYDDGKYSVSESNDLRPDALERFLDSSVALTRAMTPDPYRQITDPALYEGLEERELRLYDPEIASVGPDFRAFAAAAAEQAALDEAGDRAISAEASFEDTEEEIFKLHSNGFEGEVRESQFWVFAEITLKDEGDRRPDGWDIGGSRFRSKLPDPAKVGFGAAKRAQDRVGTIRLDTARMPMIVENRAVGRFMGALLGATSGQALQQRRSFLSGMLNKRVGSDLLTLVDDPFVEEGFGSRLFDGEGITAKAMPLFTKGELCNYYIDSYYGKKLEMEPTTGGRSNLIVMPGEQSLKEMISQVDRGVLVRGFIGGNSNPTTGDFSLGVYGTLIDKGEPAGAVSEMNISGSHRDVWKRLVAAGSDVWKLSSLRTPSLMFDEMQFSGG